MKKLLLLNLLLITLFACQSNKRHLDIPEENTIFQPDTGHREVSTHKSKAVFITKSQRGACEAVYVQNFKDNDATWQDIESDAKERVSPYRVRIVYYFKNLKRMPDLNKTGTPMEWDDKYDKLVIARGEKNNTGFSFDINPFK